MSGALARIILRYLTGALVTKGLLDPQTGLLISADPDVASVLSTVLGLLMAGGTEAYYILAKRFGWGT